VIGILLIGASVVLFLAAFNSAGPAGKVVYGLLNALFGVGYYIIPCLLLVLGVLFLILSLAFILSIFPYFQKYLWILGDVTSSQNKIIHGVLGVILLFISFLLMKSHKSLY